MAEAVLPELVAAPGVLVVPGVYDAVTARLAQAAGFDALFLTGAGVSLSITGVPDLGVVSFAEVADRLSQVTAAAPLPVIADGDTGYGGPLSVIRTVREFERRGAAAIQLEDQVEPKRCGHEPGRRCVAPAEMVARLQAAIDTRSSDGFLVIARTDARTGEGLQAAINRAGAYAEAGADLLFVEALESADELRAVRAAVDTPLVVNVVEGGRTPLLSSAELDTIGYDVALYPNTLLRVLCRVGGRILEELRHSGTTRHLLNDIAAHDDVWRLFGRDDWLALESRYTPPEPPSRH